MSTTDLPDPPDSAPDPAAGDPAADLGRTDWTVPTMDDMRARIGARAATAAGQAELDALGADGRDRALTNEQRDRAATAALDRIRASMTSDRAADDRAADS